MRIPTLGAELLKPLVYLPRLEVNETPLRALNIHWKDHPTQTTVAVVYRNHGVV